MGPPRKVKADGGSRSPSSRFRNPLPDRQAQIVSKQRTNFPISLNVHVPRVPHIMMRTRTHARTGEDGRNRDGGPLRTSRHLAALPGPRPTATDVAGGRSADRRPRAPSPGRPPCLRVKTSALASIHSATSFAFPFIHLLSTLYFHLHRRAAPFYPDPYQTNPLGETLPPPRRSGPAWRWDPSPPRCEADAGTTPDLARPSHADLSPTCPRRSVTR